MKKLIIILLFFAAINLNAQDRPKEYYIGTNILSPFAGMNMKSTTANVFLPLLSNLEYGFTLNAGYYKNYHNLELRLTAGRSNPYNFIPQVQFGYNFFLLDYWKKNNSGLYVGSFVRWWDYHNTETKTDLHNISQNFTLGYTWKKKRFVTDLRLNQPILLLTSSNIENNGGTGFDVVTSPMPKLSPVLPFLSVNVAYKFSSKRE